jgi:hypothetical protein
MGGRNGAQVINGFGHWRGFDRRRRASEIADLASELRTGPGCSKIRCEEDGVMAGMWQDDVRKRIAAERGVLKILMLALGHCS